MKIGLLILAIALIPGALIHAELPQWPSEVVDLFAKLPVQEAGRIKPLDTVARFTLLRFNGKRTLTVEREDGKSTSRSAMEWMLDCFFLPEVAHTYPCFTVESYETIIALGLKPQSKKRGRYSYDALRPGLDRLMELARQAAASQAEQRTFIDTHLITLANNILAYESLTRFLDFARIRYTPEDNPLLVGIFEAETSLKTSDILRELPRHLATIVARAETMEEAERERLARGMHDLFGVLDHISQDARLFALIPPQDPETREWLSPGDVIEAAFDAEQEGRAPIEIIGAFESLVEAPLRTPQFGERLTALHVQLTSGAVARNEYRNIPLEVHYYRGRYLFFSQWLFVLAFILIACSWLYPRPGRLTVALNLSLLPPILLLAAGITLRCIIRGRPPVTTLYETILFTTLVAAVLGFILEFVSRNRISMSVGAVLGMVGMFFAWRYEAREGVDTMPTVIAVLDTNFWLATHVTTIIAGYGAGLFGAALAHVYVFARLLGLKRGMPSFYTDFGRIIYGVTAFCLVFTLIGTVLGGVWAAQSWGRFWGWDPKENGALLIVLWALAVLHAKRGGYIRHDGIAVGAVALGMIVVFAWWGVNALGVGLHSYGFISGVWRALTIFWLIESAVILAGMATLWLRAPERHSV